MCVGPYNRYISVILIKVDYNCTAAAAGGAGALASFEIPAINQKPEKPESPITQTHSRHLKLTSKDQRRTSTKYSYNTPGTSTQPTAAAAVSRFHEVCLACTVVLQYGVR